MRALAVLFCFAAFAESSPLGEENKVRLRMKREANFIRAVIYDNDGNEQIIDSRPSWLQGQMEVDDMVPVVRYDGTRWKRGGRIDDIYKEEDGYSFAIPDYDIPMADHLFMKKSKFFLPDGDYTDDDLQLFNDDKYSKLHQDQVYMSNEVKRSLPFINKRHGAAKAIVEILVVADYSVYEEALEETNRNHALAEQALRTYYSMVMALVDLRYSQMKSEDLKIRVAMSGLFIAEDRLASPWSEFKIRFHKDGMVVDPNEALNALHKWLADEMDNLPDHDHAMAFTRYPLVANNGNVASGMAYIATTCQRDGYACSVIEEVGGLSSVGTAVHELGHSLGAEHDGEGDNAACPQSNNYVMSPGNSASADVRANFFSFSQCSINEFKRFIKSGKGECLFDSEVGQISHKTAEFGNKYTPDRQCKDMHGEDSGLCPIQVDPPEEICSRIWCIKPGIRPSCTTRTSMQAVYGASCGRGKICVLGRCEHKSRLIESPSMVGRQSETHSANEIDKDPICGRDQNTAYCKLVISQSPEVCERPDVNKYCCRTCAYVR